MREYKIKYEPVNTIMDKSLERMFYMLKGNSKLIAEFSANLALPLYRHCILRNSVQLTLTDRQSALLRDITATYGIYWSLDILDFEFKIKIKNINWLLRELYKYKDIDLKRVEVH